MFFLVNLSICLKAMKRDIILGIFLAISLIATAQQTVTVSVELSNPLNRARTDAPVAIKLNELKPGFRVRSAQVQYGNLEIPYQLDDLNGDLKADELAFVIDLPAKAQAQLTITLSEKSQEKQYPPRVFAQMLARNKGKKQHAPVSSITVPGTTNFYNMVQGHGPMFESELVGYRIYFNQKQTIDPYGKFQKRLELEQSEFYPTPEQLKQGFGDDVLLVGNSGGVGALKGWNGQQATHIEPIAFRTERILASGPVRTLVEVEVKGWQYHGKELNMTHRYILYAGHRDLKIETYFDEALENEEFCAGVQNIKGNETLSYSDHQGLVASWGRHWPVNDTIRYAKETIGLATYVPKPYLNREVKDKDNFLYTLTASGQKSFCHYTMFTSRKETFGFATPEAWFNYLAPWKEELDNPIKYTIKNNQP